MFAGDSIFTKTNKALNKGHDVVVCFPWVKLEAITEKVEKIMGAGKGGSILVHIGKHRPQREGTTVIVKKYWKLVRTLMQTRVDNGKQGSGLLKLPENGI